MIAIALNAIDRLRRIPLGFLVALSLVLGLLLFLPDGIAEILAVREFRSSYRMFLGPALLLVFTFFLTKLILLIIDLVQSQRMLRVRTQQLHDLTAEEKGYLAQFVHIGLNTIYISFGDGVAGGLEAKGIIYRASSVFNMLEGEPYNLQPWASEYLKNNLHLLEGGVGRPLTNEEKIFGNRL